jgi:threonyl-tRNA synthetase
VDSAHAFVADLKKAGIRAEISTKESLSYRIREAEIRKIPYMCVIGEREAAQQTVAVRRRGAGKKQEVMARDAFRAVVLEEIRTREVAAETPTPAADRA